MPRLAGTEMAARLAVRWGEQLRSSVTSETRRRQENHRPNARPAFITLSTLILSTSQTTHRNAIVITSVDDRAMVDKPLGGIDIFDRVQGGVTVSVGEINVAAWCQMRGVRVADLGAAHRD